MTKKFSFVREAAGRFDPETKPARAPLDVTYVRVDVKASRVPAKVKLLETVRELI
jgi:hypothetical protein